jgi:hypothetical protein
MIVRGLLLPDFDHPPDADTLRDSYLGALRAWKPGCDGSRLPILRCRGYHPFDSGRISCARALGRTFAVTKTAHFRVKSPAQKNGGGP